jgi:hypothetical protein
VVLRKRFFFSVTPSPSAPNAEDSANTMGKGHKKLRAPRAVCAVTERRSRTPGANCFF